MVLILVQFTFAVWHRANHMNQLQEFIQYIMLVTVLAKLIEMHCAQKEILCKKTSFDSFHPQTNWLHIVLSIEEQVNNWMGGNYEE